MAQNRVYKCDICTDDKTKTAIIYCNDCEQFICADCKSSKHDKIRGTRHHTSRSVKGLDYIKPRPKCKQHEMEFVFYCKSCKTLTCINCITSTHVGHEQDQIGNIIKGYRKDLKSKYEELKLKERNFEKYQLRETMKAKEVKKHKKLFNDQIKAKSATFYALVDDVTASFLTNAEQFCENEQKELEANVNKMDLNHKRMSSICKKLDDLSKEYDDTVFFVEYDSMKSLMKTEFEHPTPFVVKKVELVDDDRFADSIVEKICKTYSTRLSLNAKLKDLGSFEDFADKFRPMKICEMYLSIFEDDWTEAFEVLTDQGWDEDTVIRNLCITLQACFKSCVVAAAEQMDDLVKLMFRYVSSKKIEACSKWHAAELQQLMDARKRVAKEASNDVAKDIYTTDTFESEIKKYNGIQDDLVNKIINSPYFAKCTTVCWMMVVQDPPMLLDEDIQQGTKLDKEIYKPFTSSGSRVLFSVWPAMFLHQNGPLLVKGVAQCTK